MTATNRAKAYLSQLAPHIKGRKAAEVIRGLIAENDKQCELLRRALVAIDNRADAACVKADIRRVLE